MVSFKMQELSSFLAMRFMLVRKLRRRFGYQKGRDNQFRNPSLFNTQHDGQKKEEEATQKPVVKASSVSQNTRMENEKEEGESQNSRVGIRAIRTIFEEALNDEYGKMSSKIDKGKTKLGEEGGGVYVFKDWPSLRAKQNPPICIVCVLVLIKSYIVYPGKKKILYCLEIISTNKLVKSPPF